MTATESAWMLQAELPPGWAEALQAAPRTAFLPDVIWPKDPAAGRTPRIDRREDPEGWAAWATRNVPIVTQWDDGEHTGSEPGHMPTSSSPRPSLVAGMLADLDVHPGHRVLDVGVGTGWTTGLLAARVGSAGRVVGVEVDPDLADAARRRLHRLGLTPLVVTGDGNAGWPQEAPYDRVQATYAVQQIPRAWVEQTRPGGVIVAPWRARPPHAGAVVRLTVHPDGTASGPFTRPAEFMQARAERLPWIDPDDYHPGEGWPPDTRESTTPLRPEDLWEDAAAWFAVGLPVPDVVHTTSSRADGTTIGWLFSLRCRSWAVVFFDDEPEAEVYQGGPRRLWNEVEAAHRWWTGQGRPGHAEFGLTVGPGGERVWPRSPDNPLPTEATL